VVLEHAPAQQYPPQHCASAVHTTPSWLQVGQAVLEHSFEQQDPPQHSEPVVHAVASWPQVGQALAEHVPEQQSPLQQSESTAHALETAPQPDAISHTPSVQVVPEQHSPAVHAWPSGTQTVPLELAVEDELAAVGCEPELELPPVAPVVAVLPVPPLPPFSTGTES
jgi:hypothetical protein